MIGVVGDFHIPSRAREIPRWMMKKLGKCELILCTGDFTTRKTLGELEELSKVKAVRGNMDSLDLPSTLKLTLNEKKILLFHGYGIHPRGNLEQLLRVAKDFSADIMIHGHTHRCDVRKYGGILFLNPGSATGVWSGGGIEPRPSMLILEISDEIRIKILEGDRILDEKVF
ncbi:MAG: YfcE family phosphodiesterase [Candidatus Methanofastidiosia archaeon]